MSRPNFAKLRAIKKAKEKTSLSLGVGGQSSAKLKSNLNSVTCITSTKLTKSNEQTTQTTLSKFFNVQSSSKNNDNGDRKRSLPEASASNGTHLSKKAKNDEVVDLSNPPTIQHASTSKCSPKLLDKLEQFSSEADNSKEFHELLQKSKEQLHEDEEDPTGEVSAQKVLDFTSIQRKTFNKKVKYTPLEQQVVALKEKYGDAVLFVECGYKYRFFGEDAEIAAKELHIFCHPDHNFMTASVPTHRLYIHVQRLVAKGYKVGVVKQTETAALKAVGDNRSAPFTRELSALYTKSTLIGEDVDPESCGDAAHTVNTYLMCLHETPVSNKQTNIAIVAVQPSTGDVVYDEFLDDSGRHQLDLRISHLRPVEMLCCEKLSSQTERFLTGIAAVNSTDDDRMRIERVPPGSFEPSLSTTVITEFLKENSKQEDVLKSVLAMPLSVLCCLQALIKYLRDFHLHSVLSNTSCFHHFSSERKHMMLNASTLRNLEIFHNQTDGKERGSLFWFLNQTKTRFGSRRLHEWLSKPLVQKESIEARLKAVEEIIEDQNPTLRDLSSTLGRLPDLQRSLVTIQQKKCSTGDFMATCRALEQIKAVMENNTFQSKLLNNITEKVPNLLSGIHEWTRIINESAAKAGDKINLFIDLPQEVASRQAQISSVLGDLEDHKKTLRKTLSNPCLEYKSILGTEFLVEVKNSQLQMVPKEWTKINSTKALSRYHSPLIMAACRTLAQLREQLLMDAQHAWLKFLSSFDECFIEYRTAVSLLADLDCLFSLARVARQHDFCCPQISEDYRQIEIQDGRHPVVDVLLGENQQYVPNDTDLKGDGERWMILTGPNMGGKSSYIRQVAIIALLSHMGSFVPASSVQIGILDGIFTRMGAHDEMFAGRSTFMVELQETNEIIQAATERSLVILDELGRGTSTHDGQAIAHATLRHLVQEIGCLGLFVTHYQSLSALELSYPGTVSNFHMSFLLEDGVLTFLYQCVRDAADRSYGLNVARLADVPESILDLAALKSKDLEESTDRRVYLKRILRLIWSEDEEDRNRGMRMIRE